MLHPRREKLFTNEVPIVVMNRESRPSMRTKVFSKATEKGALEQGLAWVEGW